jgi:hypothetical protein
MKTIQPSSNKEQWPRHAVESVETRKRDLVIRITDWMDDEDEPAFDVECYIGGVYDWNESEGFTLSSGLNKAQAKQAAIAYAQAQIARLL